MGRVGSRRLPCPFRHLENYNSREGQKVPQAKRVSTTRFRSDSEPSSRHIERRIPCKFKRLHCTPMIADCSFALLFVIADHMPSHRRMHPPRKKRPDLNEKGNVTGDCKKQDHSFFRHKINRIWFDFLRFSHPEPAF